MYPGQLLKVQDLQIFFKDTGLSCEDTEIRPVPPQEYSKGKFFRIIWVICEQDLTPDLQGEV